MSDEKPAKDKTSTPVPSDGDGGNEPKEPVKDPIPEVTFTQSQFDTRVAEIEKQMNEKHGDTDAIKKELADLRKADTERKQADMSELEKANNRNKELEDQNKALENDNLNNKIELIKIDVLSGKEFKDLTGAYRSTVTGETREDIQASAKATLEIFTKDMKSIGKDISIPSNLAKDDSVNDLDKTLRDQINDKLKKKHGQEIKK